MESEDRAWGSYVAHMRTRGCVFKTLTIKPGQKLSYQYHNFRSEVWCIGLGSARITKNDVTSDYKSGDTISFAIKDKHCVENIGTCNLIIYEMQYGTMCDENDIVRISDIYGRA